MPAMQSPTPQEALVLIQHKRERAKAAMGAIVHKFTRISNEPEPGLQVLLDYLTNMVYALELLLKVLADDWRNPDKTHFGHKVGAMYTEIFGRPHVSPILMETLQLAIINQKFIYQPANRLMDQIPAMEALWDELSHEFYGRNFMSDSNFQREVAAPPELIQFLKVNLQRFLKPRKRQWAPRLPQHLRAESHRLQIAALQSELDRVEKGDEPPEETLKEAVDRMQHEYMRDLEMAVHTFEYDSRRRDGSYSFGSWSFSKVLPGFLG